MSGITEDSQKVSSNDNSGQVLLIGMMLRRIGDSLNAHLIMGFGQWYMFG